jgi:hypothetical protein
MFGKPFMNLIEITNPEEHKIQEMPDFSMSRSISNMKSIESAQGKRKLSLGTSIRSIPLSRNQANCLTNYHTATKDSRLKRDFVMESKFEDMAGKSPSFKQRYHSR